MGFSQEQLDKLKEELSADRVCQREQSGRKLSYIEGYDAINAANEIFGFDGWDYDIVGGIEGIKTIRAGMIAIKDAQGLPAGFSPAFVSKAVVKVTVRLPAGEVVTRTDVGLCVPSVSTKNGNTEPTPDSIETSEKGAVTDALKRALRSFGSQFGNSLYDKDSLLAQQVTATNATAPQQQYAVKATSPTVVSSSTSVCANCGGAMEQKSGVNKDGKPWKGMFCVNQKANGCKPLWG